MAVLTKKKQVCSNGHTYFKTSSCPVCPVCEKERKPGDGLLAMLAAPARRALEKKGIKTPVQLSKYSEREMLQLHGMGLASLPALRQALKKAGLTFKK